MASDQAFSWVALVVADELWKDLNEKRLSLLVVAIAAWFPPPSWPAAFFNDTATGSDLLMKGRVSSQLTL